MRSPGALANPQTVLAMFGTPHVATGALVLAIPAARRALNVGAWVRSWHKCDIARSRMDVRFRGKNGHAADITGMTESDPERSFEAFTRLAYRP
jgi:hypothetical protein